LTASVQSRHPDRLKSGIFTFAIISVYAAVMVCTNTRYTIIDDEANFIVAAAQAPGPCLTTSSPARDCTICILPR
jgi:hypothetical protein